MDGHPEAGIPQRRVDELAGIQAWEQALSEQELEAIMKLPNPLGWYDVPKAWLEDAIQAGGSAAVAILIPEKWRPEVVVRTRPGGFEAELRVSARVLGAVRRVVLAAY